MSQSCTRFSRKKSWIIENCCHCSKLFHHTDQNFVLFFWNSRISRIQFKCLLLYLYKINVLITFSPLSQFSHTFLYFRALWFYIHFLIFFWPFTYVLIFFSIFFNSFRISESGLLQYGFFYTIQAENDLVTKKDEEDCRSGMEVECFSENWSRIECKLNINPATSVNCKQFNVIFDHSP